LSGHAHKQRVVGATPTTSALSRRAAIGVAPAAADERTATTTSRAARATSAARRLLTRYDWTPLLLAAIVLGAFALRIYGINWDANNHLHPDEREIVFRAMCLSFPGGPRVGSCDPTYTGPGWFFNIASPLNPHFFAYGSFPLYLLAAVAHGLAWLTRVTGGAFHPSDGGSWDDFNHFTLIGRALSALFDTGSVLLAGLIARRLAGRWAGVLAAAFVAVIPFEVQVSHFYAVDTVLLFFVLLTLLACVMLAQSRRPVQALAAANPATQGDSDGADYAASAITIARNGNGEAIAETDDDEAYYDTTTTPAVSLPMTMGRDSRSPQGRAGLGETLPSVWRAWGLGVFVGVAFGLAMASKISAAPLLAPIVIALWLLWRRRGFEVTMLAAAGAVAAGLTTFIVTSPYALIDWKDFQAQTQEQTQLSQGLLDYPYVRQFANTTPYLYQIRQMLLFDMGLALGLLGLIGFAWAAWRVWRSIDSDWAIIVVFTLGYFAVIGDAYTKFTRYMLPVFAPLAICGACAIVAFVVAQPAPVAAWRRALMWMRSRRLIAASRGAPRTADLAVSGTRRRYAIAGLTIALLVLACTAFEALSLDNIYSAPNSRVQASEWLYNHLPAGSTVTYEVWDDPLPIQVPAAYTRDGIPYTAAGHPINPSEYGQIGLNLYDQDTAAKAQQMAQSLATANAVVVNSQRLLLSIPKLPDRYPMTIRYYQLLFAGKLGFHLAYHIATHPNLFGITLNETGADESFSVYDHPPVWIFMRTGPGLTANQIDTLLTQGLSLPPVSNRAGSQKPLLLSPQDAAADAQSAPLGVQFPATSLPNQLPLLWWLVIVELLGVVTFPLAFHVFPGLYDKGWGLSKTLGLLVLAYLVWLPASLRLLPFASWMVALMFALLAFAGAAVAWLRREALWAFVRTKWRPLLLCEVLFLATFLAFTWVRALDPDLWHIYRGGEKPMELAFLDAILRSRYFPPFDPWFSGGYINYYYYGQYLIAVLIKLTGIVPTVAFNLALPLLFGLTFTGAFSVVSGLTRRWWAGIFGGIALVVMGNLDGFQQEVARWQIALKGMVPPAFDYWRSSRVIPYTINEFPYWSFLYGDLHAHLIDLPIVVLIIGCCASLLGQDLASSPTPFGRSGWAVRAAPTLAVIALALGAAWCTNTWDVPTYALLAAVALALGLLPTGAAAGGWRAVRARVNWPTVRGYLVALALTFGATYALYYPFHSGFQNFTSGTGSVTTPTDPGQFFTLFGLWLFLTASFLTLELYDRIEARRVAWGAALRRFFAPTDDDYAYLSGDGRYAAAGDNEDDGDYASAAPIGGAYTLQSDGSLAMQRTMSVAPAPAWAPTARLLIVGVVSALTLDLAYHTSLNALLAVMIAVGLFLGLNPRHSPTKLLTYALLLLGLGVALGVEIIYVRDFLDNSPWERMNTVFKFYYQVWTLLALGSALAATQLITRLIGDPTPASADADPDAFTAPPAPPASVPLPLGEGNAQAAGQARVGAGHARVGAMEPSPVPATSIHYEAEDDAPADDGPRTPRDLVGALVMATRPLIAAAWLLTLTGLIVGSLVFLFAGTAVRVQDPSIWAAVSPPPGGVQPQGLSLDGMAYMRGWYPQDYAAITWMNLHIGGDPTIVEASNGPYAWYGRVSIYTGLPSVLGWSSHESQQRYPDPVYARQADVQNFYGTPDPGAAESFLHTYGVRYVYVGVLERTCYMTDQANNCIAMSAPAQAKYATLVSEGVLRVVYQQQQTTIYEVVG